VFVVVRIYLVRLRDYTITEHRVHNAVITLVARRLTMSRLQDASSHILRQVTVFLWLPLWDNLFGQHTQGGEDSLNDLLVFAQVGIITMTSRILPTNTRHLYCKTTRNISYVCLYVMLCESLK